MCQRWLRLDVSDDQEARMTEGMGPAPGLHPNSRLEPYGIRRLAEFTGQHESWRGIIATDTSRILIASIRGKYSDKDRVALLHPNMQQPFATRQPMVRFCNTSNHEMDGRSKSLATIIGRQKGRFSEKKMKRRLHL